MPESFTCYLSNIPLVLKLIILSFIVSADGEVGLMEKFFKDHDMYLHIKTKGRHSNLAENSIRSVKRTLYYILRRKKSKNWSKYLSKAVDTGMYNSTEVQKCFGLMLDTLPIVVELLEIRFVKESGIQLETFLLENIFYAMQ